MKKLQNFIKKITLERKFFLTRNLQRSFQRNLQIKKLKKVIKFHKKTLLIKAPFETFFFIGERPLISLRES